MVTADDAGSAARDLAVDPLRRKPNPTDVAPAVVTVRSR
jgi:hypothetical protein